MAKKVEVIYGIHAVRHALNRSPADVLELWIQEGKQAAGELAAIVAMAATAMRPVQYVSRATLDKISAGGVHQGIAIKRRRIPTPIGDLGSLLDALDNTVPLLLVLDGIQDPHNLGACLRTANATGVDAVIIPADRTVSVNATVCKIASGAAEHTPVITVTNLARTLTQLQERGLWCFGLSEAAESEIYATDLTVPIALVLGAEGKGLRQNTRRHCDKLVSIPMFGQVESLNVSVAAAVCLYEAVRQRIKNSGK